MLDSDEVRQLIADLKRRPRRHASWFEWIDKPGKELGVAQEFAVALERVSGSVAEHVELGGDPPDIVLSLQGGASINLELTELVNQKAIEAQLGGAPEYAAQIFDWDNRKIASRIRERVQDKEMKCRALSSTSARLILLMHTDEMVLSEKVVQEALDEHGPIRSDVFDEIWLLFSYEPKNRIYPLLRLD